MSQIVAATPTVMQNLKVSNDTRRRTVRSAMYLASDRVLTAMVDDVSSNRMG